MTWLVTGLFFIAAGAITLYRGYSGIKTKRLANTAFSELVTGVRGVEGEWAVRFSKFFLVAGYAFIGIGVLGTLGGGISLALSASQSDIFRQLTSKTRRTPQGQSSQGQPRQGEQSPSFGNKPWEGNASTSSSRQSFEERTRQAREEHERRVEEAKRQQQAAQEEFERRRNEIMSGSGGFGANPANPFPPPSAFPPGNTQGQEPGGGATGQEGDSPFSGLEKPRSEPPDSSKPRTWTSASGDYTVVASLVEQTDTEITLKKEDGATIKVPKAKLSQEDLNWLSALK